jgi:hypothetical protein
MVWVLWMGNVAMEDAGLVDAGSREGLGAWRSVLHQTRLPPSSLPHLLLLYLLSSCTCSLYQFPPYHSTHASLAISCYDTFPRGISEYPRNRKFHSLANFPATFGTLSLWYRGPYLSTGYPPAQSAYLAPPL